MFVFDIFICTGLHDLRYKADMLHRDISINNIMFQLRDDRYYFILIDFDMAVIIRADGPKDKDGTYVAASKFRTGTLPFMAHALVSDASLSDIGHWNPVRHLLCHDLESLF